MCAYNCTIYLYSVIRIKVGNGEIMIIDICRVYQRKWVRKRNKLDT